MGKLTDRELKQLLSCIRKNEQVIVPPKAGYDSGVHRIGDKYLVVSTDPCSGVPSRWFGFLLINYAASDVALFGARPEYCTINLLGPPGTRSEIFQEIMEQACEASDELGIFIITGHTGRYDSLNNTLGVCTAYGTVEPENLKTPGSAQSKDLILCTKPIGLETAVNFSLTHTAQAVDLFSKQSTTRLSKEIQMQSCVKEALQLAELKSVHAMHDATEGGLIAALNEVASASNLGFKINYGRIPLTREVRILQEAFGLSDNQVLSMSSTGTILAAVSSEGENEVREILNRMGLEAHFLGEFMEDKKKLLIQNNQEQSFPKVADDPYTRILS